MDTSSWLIEKKYHELRQIAKSTMDREKSARMKANAYMMMGRNPEFEEEGKKLAKANAYIRTAASRVDLKAFLSHHEKKRAECSEIDKKILLKLWLKAPVTDNDRLRV